MSDDRRRRGQQASQRDDALRRWIAHEVHPYCEPVRERLDACGLGQRGVRTAADLARLPLVELDELGDGRAWVLRPTADRIRAAAAPVMRAKLLAADVTGRPDGFTRREVDPAFKPVSWTAARHAGGVLLTGSTPSDVALLTRLGRRALAVSGVVPDDRVACLAGAGTGPIQLELGALDAGLPHLRIAGDGPADVLHAAAPTVLSGTPAQLADALDAGAPASVRLLVVHVGAGDDGGGLRALRRSGLPVRLWWAPAGVRAAWATCEADQLHTWPEHEHVEVVDDAGRPAEVGRLVWSAVGWRGSVWLRLALGPVGRVERGTCACGRTTPRVLGARRPVAAGAAR